MNYNKHLTCTVASGEKKIATLCSWFDEETVNRGRGVGLLNALIDCTYVYACVWFSTYWATVQHLQEPAKKPLLAPDQSVTEMGMLSVMFFFFFPFVHIWCFSSQTREWSTVVFSSCMLWTELQSDSQMKAVSAILSIQGALIILLHQKSFVTKVKKASECE